MFSTLGSNLLLILILTLMYLGSLIANTILGIYNNTSNLKETFSKEKLLNGLLKGLIILVGAMLITVIISLLPEVLTAFGISASSTIVESISVAAMAGVLGSTVMKYAVDAVKKLYTILGAKTEETEGVVEEE